MFANFYFACTLPNEDKWKIQSFVAKYSSRLEPFSTRTIERHSSHLYYRSIRPLSLHRCTRPTPTGRSVGRSVGRSIGRSVGRSVGRSFGRSVGRPGYSAEIIVAALPEAQSCQCVVRRRYVISRLLSVFCLQVLKRLCALCKSCTHSAP